MTPVASLESTTFNPDDLLVSGFPLKAEKITLKSGQNCVRGTVLGRVAGAVTTAAAGAGVAGANTGDGTIGTVTLGAGAKGALEMLRKINDEARAEQAKAKEEQAKYTADGDKEKAKLAQQRGQQFQQLSQAAGNAIRNIGGK